MLSSCGGQVAAEICGHEQQDELWKYCHYLFLLEFKWFWAWQKGIQSGLAVNSKDWWPLDFLAEEFSSALCYPAVFLKLMQRFPEAWYVSCFFLICNLFMARYTPSLHKSPQPFFIKPLFGCSGFLQETGKFLTRLAERKGGGGLPVVKELSAWFAYKMITFSPKTSSD